MVMKGGLNEKGMDLRGDPRRQRGHDPYRLRDPRVGRHHRKGVVPMSGEDQLKLSDGAVAEDAS